MTPSDSSNRYRLIESLYQQASDLPRERRAAFLAGECAEDPDLKREVETLLKHYDAADNSFLSQLPGEAMRLAMPPASVGPYRLVEVIGEGGFGTVWRADQLQPVQRPVALKLIKLGMDTRQVVARFEAERQALALMDHPNIARVYDGGATENGRPYFVMELVKGVPITRYCDEQRLDIPTRLKLFCTVCQAVQHAHQKGIIHRDIKPSNVLVATHDGAPSPKVIDFGISKAIHNRLTEQTLQTEYGQFVGTPDYVAPEQADATGLDVDTRADIYSLGILLHELLTGTTPMDAQALRAGGIAEMQRKIREFEAQRPSLRFSGLSTRDAVAEHRGVDAGRLSQMLRGDLDWIVLKAVEKDRSRRYETANGLSEDIRRYLQDEPVSATPPSGAYRLSKFVRRNRGAVTAAALVAAALVVGFAGTAWQAVVATQQYNLAQAAGQAKDRALQEAETAKKEADDRSKQLEDVAKFQAAQLVEIDAAEMGFGLRRALLDEVRAALRRSKRDDATIDAQTAELETLLAGANFTNLAVTALDRSILERTIKAIDKEFAEQPLVRARLLHTSAHVLYNLGILDRAIEAEREALRIWREVLGDDDRHTLSAINNLGHHLHGRGRLEEAEPLLREAVQGYRRTLGSEHEETLAATSNLAALLRDRRESIEAEQLYREVLETRVRVFGEDHRSTLLSYNSIAVMLAGQGKRREAETYYQRALEGRRRVLGDDHPDTLHTMMNLGASFLDRGQFAEAEPLLREALERSRRIRGDEHPDTFSALFFMGNLLRESGQLDAAEPFLRESLDGRRRILGSDHPKTLQGIGLYAALLKDKGKPHEAEVLFREALERSLRVHGEDHPGTVAWVNALGNALIDQNKPVEAEAYYRQGLESRRRILGNEHPETLPSIGNVASALMAQNKLAEAEPYLKEALELSSRVMGADHPNTLVYMNNMSRLLRRMDRREQAEALSAETVRRAKAKLPAGHWHIALFVLEHGIALAKLKRFAEAEAEMREAHDLLVAALGPSHARTKICVDSIAAMYDDWHTHDPDGAHDRQAAEWRARTDSAVGKPQP